MIFRLKRLDQLIKGQSAIIDSFTDLSTSLKLMELGCIPGTEVIMDSVAPLGDPIAIEFSGSKISLRKSEAATVIVK
jgi:ferrous iron transport protein A